MMWVPPPLGAHAPVERFSEARALHTAAYLSEDIGIRLVRPCLPLLAAVMRPAADAC